MVKINSIYKGFLAALLAVTVPLQAVEAADMEYDMFNPDGLLTGAPVGSSVVVGSFEFTKVVSVRTDLGKPRQLLTFSRSSHTAVVMDSSQKEDVYFEICSLPPQSEGRIITIDDVGQCSRLGNGTAIKRSDLGFFIKHFAALLEIEIAKAEAGSKWTDLLFYVDAAYLSALSTAGGLMITAHAGRVPTLVARASFVSGGISLLFYLWKVYGYAEVKSANGQYVRDLDGLVKEFRGKETRNSAEAESAELMRVMVESLERALTEYRQASVI